MGHIFKLSFGTGGYWWERGTAAQEMDNRGEEVVSFQSTAEHIELTPFPPPFANIWLAVIQLPALLQKVFVYLCKDN